MNTFQPGDQVQESGGDRPMTVLWCTQDLVYCAWFEETTLVNGLFAPADLTTARTPDPAG
ncbi:hypothetical protein [Ramlibacter alkalitolerans]|uniref:DUF2158 domain-containing protein n=1 Tax=Ramlibacter alkalitolerans TaxID=2039631 RepID=A0ABS1JKI7_9BURK|nr:hypothetical protein [Ramlibacter alkalitolerans]MBL0424750.1 hypothetical protein [Ramlibacter alkalitolerans]